MCKCSFIFFIEELYLQDYNSNARRVRTLDEANLELSKSASQYGLNKIVLKAEQAAAAAKIEDFREAKFAFSSFPPQQLKASGAATASYDINNYLTIDGGFCYVCNRKICQSEFDDCTDVIRCPVCLKYFHKDCVMVRKGIWYCEDCFTGRTKCL